MGYTPRRGRPNKYWEAVRDARRDLDYATTYDPADVPAKQDALDRAEAAWDKWGSS